MRKTMYTVQRVRKSIDVFFYGPQHASEDGSVTICGKQVEENGCWYILINDYTGVCNCKVCLKILSRGLL